MLYLNSNCYSPKSGLMLHRRFTGLIPPHWNLYKNFWLLWYSGYRDCLLLQRSEFKSHILKGQFCQFKAFICVTKSHQIAHTNAAEKRHWKRLVRRLRRRRVNELIVVVVHWLGQRAWPWACPVCCWREGRDIVGGGRMRRLVYIYHLTAGNNFKSCLLEFCSREWKCEKDKIKFREWPFNDRSDDYHFFGLNNRWPLNNNNSWPLSNKLQQSNYVFRTIHTKKAFLKFCFFL